MKYRFNILAPTLPFVDQTPLPPAVYVCPVCDESGIESCDFCEGSLTVTAEKLSTYEPTL